MNREITIEDFKLCLHALWKKKLLIIAATILTSLLGLLYTFNNTADNTYFAESSVYSAAYGSYQESTTGTTAMISYSDIVTSKKVCERAAASLEGNIAVETSEIQDMVNVSAKNDAIIKIYAISKNPELAVQVTNAVAEAFVREVTSITGYDSIQVLDNAQVAYIYTDGFKELMITRLIFAAVGFALSSIWIVITELLSNKVRTIAQCIEEDEDEILGIIPHIK